MPDYDNMKISTSRLRRCLSLRTCRDPAYRTGTPALARPHRRRHWSWRPSRIFLMGALTPFKFFLRPPVASAQTRLSMTQTRAFIVCLTAHSGAYLRGGSWWNRRFFRLLAPPEPPGASPAPSHRFISLLPSFRDASSHFCLYMGRTRCCPPRGGCVPQIF